MTQTTAAGSRQQKIRLGDLLVEKEVITEGQLKLALGEQKNSGKKIGRLLVDMGMVAEDRMLHVLAGHLQIPFLDLRRFNLNSELINKLPESHARRYRCLLLAEREDSVQLAMSDPLDLMAQDEVARTLGKTVEPAIVRESELLATLDQVYRKSGEIASLAGELETELRESDFDLAQLAGETDTKDAPVVRLLQTILEDAVQAGASDIHIEPDETTLRVRLRVDGMLQEQVMKEKRAANALVLRLKIMSNLDISEKRMPQDGRFNIRILDKSIDIRLSTMPTQYGESVVMRLLDQTAGILSLNGLGMPPSVLERFRLQIERPHGMILVTGPTGSGKTTTLYAALTELNKAHRKIITAEDPIEYRLPRIQQVQVNPKIELDFARILRSALRQDPDVILVGEMRDQETVSVGVRAALTGHMVLSTLHTNDAISSAMRLADMGVEPHLVASSLRAIVAQRLVRRICDNCSQPYTPDNRQRIWLSHLGHEPDEEVQYFRGQGCYQCNNTGYRGRIGVYELLELDDNMLFALRDQDPNRFVEAANRSPYFVNMTERALEYAREGITDLTEVFRITADLEDRDFGLAGSQKVRHGGAAGHQAARNASMAASTAPSSEQAADPKQDQPVEPLPSQDFQDSGLSLQPLDLDDDSSQGEDNH
ncbi:type II/IV secretion system protein [Natronospirillum operosum]|uniref:Type II/IV secretion system protein n=1 Tax=Natronospirillum operosum TaxID=2759953 RepID=A0A4Z0WBT8_9GAMM|nr:GspE/PulE family protein [Natronospirillum operosum]TGG92345.1 type II/IV secretion system protein [Natronospirillum operosum]